VKRSTHSKKLMPSGSGNWLKDVLSLRGGELQLAKSVPVDEEEQ